MALVALEIPKVGLVMENARLVRWLKNVGDVVKQGEPLLELETEKSVVEIEATENGRLVDILLQVDQEVRVGDRIAWLENDAQGAVGPGAALARSAPAGHGEAVPPARTSRGAATHGPAAQVSSDVATVSAPLASHASASTAAAAPPPDPDRLDEGPTTLLANLAGGVGRIRSSPVARRLASQHAVDLGRITGTGPRGRVQLTDVQREIEARSTTSAPPGLQPLSSMRRALARSMTLSNATIPQFSVERAVDWTALHTLRARFLAELSGGETRPSVNDFLLQGIARTLIRFPTLNATFWDYGNSSDAGIVPAKGAHIGLVVAVENGLLLPVLHDVEQLGLAELARRRTDIVERALKGKLKREELEGATISLSNLGAHGPDRFNAIINPPQLAILAVGRQRDCVVAINGDIHVRPMSQLTLTVDHRVADGRLASDFLAALVEIVEGDTWHLT